MRPLELIAATLISVYLFYIDIIQNDCFQYEYIVNGNCNVFLCLVSLDPSQITIILFTAQETFLIIISVDLFEI